MTKQKANSQPQQTVEKFVIRLPKGMRSRIADISRRSHRSMNSEIIARLEESMALIESPTSTDVSVDLQDQPASQPDQSPLTNSAGNIRIGVGRQGSNHENILLQRIRQLPEKKREALLKLLE